MQTTSDAANLFRTETSLAEEEARKNKYDLTKDLGSPIDTLGKPLDLIVQGDDIWVAESAAVVRKLDLETGSVLQAYKGHNGPVTSICLFTTQEGTQLLASGSWDKSIKMWDTTTRAEISTTPAHADFVKCLLVIPSMKLLISGGSDKCIRFWDISSPTSNSALPSLGYVSEHTRPLQCLAVDSSSVTSTACVLFTADTMGVIMVWDVERTHEADGSSCRATLRQEISGHRTGVNSLWHGEGRLWSASTDETVRIQDINVRTDPSQTNPPPSPIILHHPKPVKALLPLGISLATTSHSPHLRPSTIADHIDATESYVLTAYGDIIRLYDLSSGGISSPDVVGEVDGHWYDVTGLRAWLRSTEDGRGTRVEVWIVSAGLDGTIRKWRFSDFTTPPKSTIETDALSGKSAPSKAPDAPKSGADMDVKSTAQNPSVQLTEEEERELAELMEESD